jgi:hypothetical protein
MASRSDIIQANSIGEGLEIFRGAYDGAHSKSDEVHLGTSKGVSLLEAIEFI